MNHCNCCYPACPVPTIEAQEKSSNCAPLPTYAFYQNFAPTRQDGDGSKTYVVPIPERCRPFRKLRQSITGSHSFTREDEYGRPTRILSISGGSEVIWDRKQPCPTCEQKQTATGSSNYSFSDEYFGTIYYDDEGNAYPDGEEPMYVSNRITSSAVYGGKGSKLPDHQPEDPIGEHGDFIITTTIYSQTPTGNGTFNETTATTHEFRNGITHAFYGQLFPNDKRIFINTPTSYTETRSADPNNTIISTNRTQTSITEWLEPWNEQMLFDAAKNCADSQEWKSNPTSIIAEKNVEYSEVNVLDENGNTVFYDHDNNPETPDIIKRETSKDCFDSIEVKKGRYRIVIPHNFDPPPPPAEQRWHGTWHRVQLEETFTPLNHDPQNTTPPQPIISQREVIWKGPGQELETFAGWNALNEDQQEARRNTWKTNWITVDVPNETGTISVKIKRSQCYHGAPWAKHS